MALTVVIIGIDVATARTNALMEKMKTVASTIFNQVGNEMVSEMKAGAPVLTGFLRENITLVQANEQIMHISSFAPYSIYVEFGHKIPGKRGTMVPPHAFFFPVVYTYIPQITQRMSAFLSTF